MKKTKIYLSHLSKVERERMTEALPFLRSDGDKTELLAMAATLYGEGVTLDLQWDNGHYPYEYHARKGDADYLTIMQFEKRHLTEQTIKLLGITDSTNFPYYYAIMLGRDDRRLYLASFTDKCSPNWNLGYDIMRIVLLEDVDCPLLTADGTIYRMDDALHAAVNRRLAERQPLFTEDERGWVRMTVCDQHGNYAEIVGRTLDEVFRDYADNYTGYCNYRRQTASEWAIADDGVRQRYENWKQTATGLKSDFDKFYGSGIVD